MNQSLEQDLRSYCKLLDSQLFEDKLLQPLTNLAKSICSKYEVPQNEYDNMVADLVSHAATILPKYYDENKSNAKATCYILMSQYLSNQCSYNQKQKRDFKRLVYIEDLDNSNERITHLIALEIDDFQLMKQTLLEHRNLFKRLKNKLHRNIVKRIIEAIEHPERFKSNKGSFTINIAKRCGVERGVIYKVISDMKDIIESVSA
jgi:hypothetical protein